MRTKRTKAKLKINVHKTDLRAPGQAVIIDGRPEHFQNLMAEQPVAGILPSVVDRARPAVSSLPSGDDDDGWGPRGDVAVNQNPTPLSLLGERVGRGAREARKLMQRIGRPRQP